MFRTTSQRVSGLLAGLALLVFSAPAWATDTDNDGLTDAVEAALGTDPNDADTDGDGWTDGQEVNEEGTNPLLEDMDLDTKLDAADNDPFDPGSGELEGTSTPDFAGYATSEAYAPSGESPRAGAGIQLASGVLVRSYRVGNSKGIRTTTLRPNEMECCDEAPMPSESSEDTEFALDLVFRSDSTFNGRTGLGVYSFLDAAYTVDGSGNFSVFREDGLLVQFVRSGFIFITPTGMRGTLSLVGSVYTFTTPEGAKHVYEDGVLQQMEDRFGNVTELVRTSGKVTSVIDARGRTHTFEYYTGTGRLKHMETADGADWYFRYNTEDELMRIEGPSADSPSGGVWLGFLYVNGSTSSALHGNLSVEIDGRGNPSIRTVYDENDRVVRQDLGGWSRNLEIDYTNFASEEVTVTDPAGNEKVWTWDATKLTKLSLVEKTNRTVRSGEGDYTTSWTHNSEGYLLTVTYPRGNGVKYTRNSVQLPTERRRKEVMTAADGSGDIVTSWAYDSSKYYGITSFTDPRGNQTSYTLNSDGQPTAVALPDVTHFSPDQSIDLSFTYNADGTMATRTDGEGSVTSQSYFASGAKKALLWKTTVDSGSGHLNLVTEFNYTDWGAVSSVTDPRGNTTSLTVQRYGNVTSIQSPSVLGYETRYEYDGNLNVTKVRRKNVDWDGTWLSTPQWWDTTVFYTMGNKVQATDEAYTSSTVRTTAFTYDENDNLIARQRGDVRVEWTYDERDLLYQRVRDPGSSPAIAATETFDYDGNGNLTTYTNARAKATTSTYDLFDRRTKVTNALTHYEERIFDKSDNLTERKWYQENGATDVLLAHHKNTFDEVNRRWKEEDLLKGTTDTWYTRTFTHDKRGLMTEHNDRRGYDTLHEYDGAGRLVEETDAAGNVRDFTLDASGNVTSVAETEKLHGTSTTETYVTNLEYDALNRLKKKTVVDRTNSSNTLVTEYKLDALSFLRKVIDPRGNATLYARDGLGRRTEESVDLGSSAAIVTQWTYDVHDNVTRLHDDNGNDTDYLFDDLNRLVQKTYESTKTVEYTLDDNGNVVEIVDENGTTTAQGFDDLDRLIGRDLTLATGVGGDTDEEFTYDALNRLTEAKDNDSIVQFTYDSLSRVVTELQGSNPLGSTGKTVTNTWDAESNLTHIDYPSGFDVERTYGETAMLTEVEDGSSASIATFQHWGPHHRMKQMVLGNGTTANYGYDGFRRPTEILHKTSGSTEFAGFDYGYDANGNPRFEARSHQSGHGDVYTYDKANRLTRALTDVVDPAAEVATPGSQSYDDKLDYNLDDLSSLTSYVVTPYGGSASTTSYTTNAMNQYTAVGSATPTYDDSGNLKDDDTQTYKFDGHNRLIEVRLKSDSSLLMSAKYDAVGRGRRFEKTNSVASVTTRTIFRGEDSIEDYEGGNLARLFVFDDEIDRPVMMEAPDVADVDDDSNTTELKRFYYHTQLIGSITHVTDASQSVVESYLYDPYGKTTIKDQSSSTVSASAIGNPWGFTARQYDPEVGLYHYRARAYSPELRRFVQRDPLEYADGPNAYAYVRGRPSLLSDPAGLRSIPAAGPGINSDDPGPQGTDNSKKEEEEDYDPHDLPPPERDPDAGAPVPVDPAPKEPSLSAEADPPPPEPEPTPRGPAPTVREPSRGHDLTEPVVCGLGYALLRALSNGNGGKTRQCDFGDPLYRPWDIPWGMSGGGSDGSPVDQNQAAAPNCNN